MKIRQMFEALARMLANGKGGGRPRGRDGEMESSKVSDSGTLVHDYEIFFLHARRCEEQLEAVEFRLEWSRSMCRGVRLGRHSLSVFRLQS
jgi:hypothetical protein